MPTFRLVSTAAHNALAVEFQDDNCASALKVARDACLEEADLWQDSAYLFTLRRSGDDETDLWTIFRKSEASERPSVAA